MKRNIIVLISIIYTIFFTFGISIASNNASNNKVNKKNVEEYMLANTMASFSNLLKISNANNKGFDFTISINNLRNEKNKVQGYAKFVAKNKAIYEDPENEDKNITFTFSKDKKSIAVDTKNCNKNICLAGNYIKKSIVQGQMKNFLNFMFR